MTYITTTSELARFCESLRGADYVTVDTEFMRERTYWPRLCLVQVGGPAGAGAIDPLAEGIELSPLFALLEDPRVTKVFHAARQDIETFFNQTGKIPAPLFDTQIAAMVCGFGESVSYENLASKLAGAKIDKSSRFTDWAHRPLTPKQIAYALDDVIHLRPVYEKLRDRLAKEGRGDWVTEEMASLSDPALYQMDPAEAWKRFKLRHEKPRTVAILKEVAAWRETEAQRIDIPRGRVMRDETLMEIVHHAPQKVEDLARTRGLSQGWAEGRHGADMLDAVRRGLEAPLDKTWMPERRDMPHWIGPTVDLLKVLLKLVADQNDVAPRLIACSDDLDRIAAEEKPDVPAMQGWRYEMFGKLAQKLKKGEISLRIEERKVIVCMHS